VESKAGGREKRGKERKGRERYAWEGKVPTPVSWRLKDLEGSRGEI